ncbi:hypothetical protein M0R45_001855 [Rubus argutus]|uniref:Uncharacterized protein n=1 Tax=Rubus argutus TaxID=59490 RepID=A0AAW1VIW5_RUBAR
MAAVDSSMAWLMDHELIIARLVGAVDWASWSVGDAAWAHGGMRIMHGFGDVWFGLMRADLVMYRNDQRKRKCKGGMAVKWWFL